MGKLTSNFAAMQAAYEAGVKAMEEAKKTDHSNKVSTEEEFECTICFKSSCKDRCDYKCKCKDLKMCYDCGIKCLREMRKCPYCQHPLSAQAKGIPL